MADERRDWRQMSAKERLKLLYNNITIEPILICYILPNVIVGLATQNMNLEKACRVNLKYDRAICDAISDRNTTNFQKEEDEIQKLVVSMQPWQSFLKNALPAVLILFLGSFSDRTGRRKPFMLFPIAGEMLTSIGLVLCTYFFYEWPMEVAGVIEGIFPGLTGGYSTIFMGVFSFIGDTISVESRTLRLGIVNVCLSSAVPIGTALSGYLYKFIGFYGVFTTVALLHFFGIIYGILRIKEANPPKKLEKNICKEFFNPMHITETFKVAFKSREGNLRLRIILVMILSFTIFGPIHGENAVGYVFARKRFNWDEVDFSFYSTYSIIVNLIGTSLGIGLFTQVLKMEDAMLGAIAYGFKIIASVCYAFASTPTTFYIATLVDMIGGTGVVAVRAITSKLVPSEELGKINSLFGVCEAVVPMIYTPLYSFVYANTIDFLPGAFFLVGGALSLPTFVIFIYLYLLQKTDPIGLGLTEQSIQNENAAYQNHSFAGNEDSHDSTRL